MKSYQKIRPVRDKRYLKFISEQRCYNCGMYKNANEDVVAAHQTIPDLKKISVKGTSIKEHDNWTLPEHKLEHDLEHYQGDKPKDIITAVIHLNNEYLSEHNKELYIKADKLARELIMKDDHDFKVKVLRYITKNWK